MLYPSAASNLIPGDDHQRYDLFLYDRLSRETRIVSVSNGSSLASDHSWLSSLTADGRYAFFDSSASNLMQYDINDTSDIFRRDLLTSVTECISCLPVALFSRL